MTALLAVKMAKVNLLGLWRDRKALVMLLAMPILITAVLSFALGGIFGSNPTIPAFPVAVYNQDAGELGKQLVATLEKQTGQMQVHEVASLSAARLDTTSNKANVVVWIPTDYSQRVERGDVATVHVESSGGHETERSVVESIVQSYGQAVANAQYVAKALPGRAKAPASAQIHPVSAGLKPVTTGAYYAIGMMVMFMLTYAVNRAGAMVRDKQGDLYRRMMASPASRYAIAGGHFASNFVILVLYGATLLVCFRFVLNIHLGPVYQVAMILIAYALALAGIAVAVGSWIDNLRIMDSIGQIGGQIAAILGGSFYPIYGFPQLMQLVGRILPNGRVLTVMVNCVMGMQTRSLLVPIAYLVCLGVVFGFVGSLRYGRSLERGGVAG